MYSSDNCSNQASASGRSWLVKVLIGIVGAVFSLGGYVRADEPDVLVIRDVAIVDLESGQLRSNQTVVWERSRIISVGANDVAVLPAAAKLVSGAGKYLMPGLWDMHVHIAATPAWTTYTERQLLPSFIVNGVTAVRDMGDQDGEDYRESSVPAEHRWDFEARAGLRVGPRIVAAATFAVNGPGRPNRFKPDFLNAETPAEARKLVRFFKDEGSADFIKVYSNIPREAYFAMMDEARRVGLTVAGHKPLTVSFIEAADAGQKSMEHAREILLDSFPGAAALQRNPVGRNLPPMRLREILDAHDPKMLREIFDAMTRNGAYYVPTHVTRLFDWKAAARDQAYLDDPRLKLLPPSFQASVRKDVERTQARASGSEDAATYHAFFEKGLEITRQAYEAGVKIMVGTDAGDSYSFHGSSLHDELVWMVKAGLSPLAVLRAATVVPAEYMGRSADFGAIEAGKLADMLLLDRNPLEDIGNTRSIHAVVMNGRLYEEQDIARMKADIQAAASH